MKEQEKYARRQHLLQRYLNAETTIDEERWLKESFALTEDDFLSEEEEAVREMLLGCQMDREGIQVSDEKAAAFDRLMNDEGENAEANRRSSLKRWCLTGAVAAAAIASCVYLAVPHVDEIPIEWKMTKVSTPPAESIPETKELAAPLPVEQEKGEKNLALIKEPKPSKTREEERVAVSENENTPLPDKTEKTELPISDMSTTIQVRNGQMETCQVYRVGDAIVVTRRWTNSSPATGVIQASDGNSRGLYSAQRSDTVMLADGIIYMIDGQQVTQEDVRRLPTDYIKEVKMLKRGSADAIKLRPEGNVHDIVLITTRKLFGNRQVVTHSFQQTSFI